MLERLKTYRQERMAKTDMGTTVGVIYWLYIGSNNFEREKRS